MSRKFYPYTERSIYKPSNGFYGFRLVDDNHRSNNKIVSDARLDANFTSAVQKPDGGPWLEIDLVETRQIKTGPRSQTISVTLRKEEMIALRDVIDAALEEENFAHAARYPEHLDPVERQIIDVIVRKAIKEKRHVEVYGDGELDAVGQGYPEITEMIAACSTTELVISDDGHFRLWVQFVHGNGCDVLSDHTSGDFYEEWLSEATALAERLEG